MEFIPRDKRFVTFDISDIKVGESIFNVFDYKKYTLCVKKEKNWKVYVYENRTMHSIHLDNPNFYINYDNEVFDVEKTKWVEEYWDKILEFLSNVNCFDNSLLTHFI